MSLRQKKIMLDCEAAGCPRPPGAKLTERGVVEIGSPDDFDDDEEMTMEEVDNLGNSLFVKEEKENIRANNFTTPDNAFGQRATMGTQSQMRQKNTGQVRNRHHTIVRANAANKNKEKLQSKLFTKEIAFDRFKHCRMCVACVSRQLHPNRNITMPAKESTS